MKFSPVQIATAAIIGEELGLRSNLLNQAITYRDPAPRPFNVQISLVEYFERITRHKADRWQYHFCNYLQEAAVNRHQKPAKAIIHAEARLGKSRILAQCYPAWLLGHDPLHRIALATYNVSQSEAHSESVIGIINLPIHRAIFRDSAGWVPLKTAKDRWRTAARRGGETDTERSFKAVGLQSGLTGAGFDCFPAETLIKTETGDIFIGELFKSERLPKVYAFNHLTNQVELRKIEALREMPADELIEFTTQRGSTIRCTPNHRIFANGRYITADQLKPGDGLFDLRGTEGSIQQRMSDMRGNHQASHGRPDLRAVSERASYSPYQPQSGNQRSGEFGFALHRLPSSASHVSSDTVSVVKRIRGINVPVYDLQVEGCGNFFAEEILVHNSLIIDDPYADAKEAFSEIVRRNLTSHFWEFTVMARIGEHSNVFGKFHRYHVEDLAGYLLDKG